MKKHYVSSFVTALIGTLFHIGILYYAFIVVLFGLALSYPQYGDLMFYAAYLPFASAVIVSIVGMVKALKKRKSAFILFLICTILSLILPVMFAILFGFSFSLLYFAIPAVAYLIAFILALVGYKKGKKSEVVQTDEPANQ